VYVAIPSNSTTHQSTRTLRIHTLYLVIRNFSGKRSCPRTARCTIPRFPLRFRTLRASWLMRSKPCRVWPEPWEAHERGMKESLSPQLQRGSEARWWIGTRRVAESAPCEQAEHRLTDLPPWRVNPPAVKDPRSNRSLDLRRSVIYHGIYP
jgi:hypothetical protein